MIDVPRLSSADWSIPFVDAHVHVWEFDRLPYPWLEEPGIPGQTAFLGDYRSIRVPWPMEHLLREFHGANVSKIVHVEAAVGGTEQLAETKWLHEVAAWTGWPHGLVVGCDLSDPAAPEMLERHAAYPLTRSVRWNWLPDDPAGSGFRRVAETLIRLRMSSELVAPNRHESAATIARLYPTLALVLGQTGQPQAFTPEYFEGWRRSIARFRDLPNIVCKISGLGMVAHDWTADSIRPWVLECVDAFGPERIMFGTNWPVDRLYGPYIALIDAYRSIIAEAGFSAEQQARMLHGTAEAFYRI